MSLQLSASDRTPSYYNGDKLMSLTDINGVKPELYICCGNRSSGKTTYYNRRVFKGWLRRRYREIGIICRYKYELETLLEQFYEPIAFAYPDLDIKQGRAKDMGYNILTVGDRILGYGLCLNSADKLKKVSNLFNSVDVLLWDEFQSSTGDYLPDEGSKIVSIHDTVSRGGGNMRRYVPVIATSNAITLLNPLLADTDIPERLTEKTKYLRGDGYVFEQNLNADAAKMINASGIHRALHNEQENVLRYEMDSYENIQSMHGTSVYLCTISYKGEEYGLRRFSDGIIYVSESVDRTHKKAYTTNINDTGLRWTMPPSVEAYRRFYQKGIVRFSGLKARAAFISFIKF